MCTCVSECAFLRANEQAGGRAGGAGRACALAEPEDRRDQAEQILALDIGYTDDVERLQDFTHRVRLA